MYFKITTLLLPPAVKCLPAAFISKRRTKLREGAIKGRVSNRGGSVFLTKLPVLMLLCILTVSSPAADHTLDYGKVLRCGPNALYMGMVIAGYSDIQFTALNGVPIGSQGASFADLKEVAEHLGVRAELRHYSTSEIRQIPLPAVGLFKNLSTSITPNHFDVIYKVDRQGVHVLNGTTGDPVVFSYRRLAEFWTGYAMTLERSPRRKFADVFWPFLVLALSGVNLAIFWPGRKARPTTRQLLTAVVKKALPLLILVGYNAKAADPSAEGHMWRDPTNSAPNLVYCFLKIYGIPCDYSQVAERARFDAGSGKTSMLTLARTAEAFGAKVRLVSLTTEQLKGCEKPAIVAMQGLKPEEGTFLMITGFSEREVYFLDGPNGSIWSSSLEEFRRNWTGVALVRRSDFHGELLLGSVGFTGGAVLMNWFRNKRRKVDYDGFRN